MFGPPPPIAEKRLQRSQGRFNPFPPPPPLPVNAARSLPNATRRGMIPSRPHGAAGVAGPRSARRAPRGAPVVISAVVSVTCALNCNRLPVFRAYTFRFR